MNVQPKHVTGRFVKLEIEYLEANEGKISSVRLKSSQKVRIADISFILA